MATIVQGKEIAAAIEREVRARVRAAAHAPRLAVVMVGDNPVTATFVSVKRRFAKRVGVRFSEHRLSDKATTEDVLRTLTDAMEGAEGVVVQLPLPPHVDAASVLASLPLEKDVDVLGNAAFDAFVRGETTMMPPVAGAVVEILTVHRIPVRGATAAIIGKGRLVGLPVEAALSQRGALTQVLDRSTPADEYALILKSADIVVSGAGVPGLIQPAMVKEGVVLIDAGTSSSGGSVVGDIAPDCESVASVFAKTPGGVGPITVAVLFRNLLQSLT